VAKGCEIAGCALIGGECAEMPDIYKPGDFDIAGFCVGVVELSRVVDAARVKKGDVVIGLRSSGVHSNGYSLVRRIIKDAGLDLDRVYPELGPDPLWKVLLEPTRIYAKPIVKLLSAYKKKKVVTGMAHITGGGLPGNLSRALGPKVDAVLDISSWAPNPIFPFLQQHGNVDRDEMFCVFNMGIGYTIIVRPAFSDAVCAKLAKLGEAPVVIGEITKGTGEVRCERAAELAIAPRGQ
jgi:phosphoribosylformylglycinamidine cyclo-ligase